MVVQFPARGSTQVLLRPFPGMLWLWHFLYTLSLCRVHSWRVRLAKPETLNPPGHLVSPLVCRSPWMPTMVLYCWFHSDSVSVLLYFTCTYLVFWVKIKCLQGKLITFLHNDIPRKIWFCAIWLLLTSYHELTFIYVSKFEFKVLLHRLRMIVTL